MNIRDGWRILSAVFFVACGVGQVGPSGRPTTGAGGSDTSGATSAAGTTTSSSSTDGATTGAGGAAGPGATTGPSGAAGDGSGGAGTGGSTGPGGGGSGGGPVGDSLLDKIVTSTVTAPAGVKPGVSNYRIWGSTSLGISPVYTAPLANCGTLVCFTTGTADTRTAPGTSNARVAVLDASDRLVRMLDLGAFQCRGLAAEPDGHFAALLWANGTATDCANYMVNGRIYVKRFDLMGAPSWSTELVNNGAAGGTDLNCPTDWSLGESRMEFGGGKYGAYYHVHSSSGHEGDSLKFVDLAGKESTQWVWGCSHSMSNVLRWNAADMKFMPACVTDCYPGTTGADFATTSKGGIYVNDRNKVIDVDAGCNGSVAGELGGAALAPSGWKIVFNTHQNPTALGQSSYNKTTMNQDVGFASIASGLTSGGVVWLTTTASINEADSSVERWQPAGDSSEQYVVGWSEPGTSYVYKLARVNGAGAFLEGPVAATAKAKWGRRDDPFRAHYNGDIVWAWFDAAAGTAMHLSRLRSGGTYACAPF